MYHDMIMPTIPPDVQRQLDQNAKNRQIEINASKIQVGSTAEQVAIYLYKEVIKYQSNLPDTEDVAMMLVQFNQSTTILVRQIGYIGYNLVCFHGEDTEGKPLAEVLIIGTSVFLFWHKRGAIASVDTHLLLQQLHFYSFILRI